MTTIYTSEQVAAALNLLQASFGDDIQVDLDTLPIDVQQCHADCDRWLVADAAHAVGRIGKWTKFACSTYCASVVVDWIQRVDTGGQHERIVFLPSTINPMPEPF